MQNASFLCTHAYVYRTWKFLCFCAVSRICLNFSALNSTNPVCWDVSTAQHSIAHSKKVHLYFGTCWFSITCNSSARKHDFFLVFRVKKKKNKNMHSNTPKQLKNRHLKYLFLHLLARCIVPYFHSLWHELTINSCRLLHPSLSHCGACEWVR